MPGPISKVECATHKIYIGQQEGPLVSLALVDPSPLNCDLVLIIQQAQPLDTRAVFEYYGGVMTNDEWA